MYNHILGMFNKKEKRNMKVLHDRIIDNEERHENMTLFLIVQLYLAFELVYLIKELAYYL